MLEGICGKGYIPSIAALCNDCIQINGRIVLSSTLKYNVNAGQLKLIKLHSDEFSTILNCVEHNDQYMTQL